MSYANHTLISGDSETLTYNVVDAAGVAVDVSGATVTYRIADHVNGTVHVTKSTALGGVVISTSIVTVTLAPADTAALAGVYWHELEIVDGAGQRRTAAGYLAIQEDIAA